MTELLKVVDVVKMLQVPEGTIFRWIKQGDIPCIEKHGEYYFNQSTLKSWAATKNIILNNFLSNEKNIENYPESKNYTLIEAILAGNIFKNVDFFSVDNFFSEIPKFMNLSEKMNHLLPHLLKQREKLSTTCIGNGIAIPHPKYLIGNEISKSMIGTFFFKKPLDFKATDKTSVFLAFVILSKNSSTHLKILSQLTNFLNHSHTIDFLKQYPSLGNIIDQINKTLAGNSQNFFSK